MLRSLVPRRSLSIPTSNRSLSLPRIPTSSSRSLATTTSTTKSTPSPSNYPELKVTTLSNGIRVASDPTPGHFVAAGVYVDAGSRYESERTRGAGHMVDRLGFKVRVEPFPILISFSLILSLSRTLDRQSVYTE